MKRIYVLVGFFKKTGFPEVLKNRISGKLCLPGRNECVILKALSKVRKRFDPGCTLVLQSGKASKMG
jgi:hypothetical protein